MDILNTESYIQRLLAAPRPGAENILAFLDYRVGAICTDPRLLLVPLDDHLCHRGDGVFETMAYYERRIIEMAGHMARLRNSAQSLNLMPPCSWDELQDCIVRVAVASGNEQGALRILLGRGPGGFGISPLECPVSSLYIIAMYAKQPDETWYAKGLQACRSSIPARQSYLARIKNINYLPNVLMTKEAHDRGVDVSLSFDEDGNLAESAIANVGIVSKQGELVVPEFTNSLPGTTVLRALELARPHMPVRLRSIREEEIFTAREFLLFSTTPGCVAIVAYEGKNIATGKPGPVAEQLRHMLRESLLRDGVPF